MINRTETGDLLRGEREGAAAPSLEQGGSGRAAGPPSRILILRVITFPWGGGARNNDKIETAIS